MIKTALLASAICFSLVVPVYAQQAAKCDEVSLTKMRTDIDAMTDQDKKTAAMKNWEGADAAFKANKLEECVAFLGDNGQPNNSGSTTGTNNTGSTNDNTQQ